MSIMRNEAALRLLDERFGMRAKVGVVLGSGLGGFADEMEVLGSIGYDEVPGLPRSTVSGHAGRLLLGKVGDTAVVVMQGRVHYYEGYSMKDVTAGVRLLADWGVEELIVTNAAGGVSEGMSVGDLMLISDHINLFPENPLRGGNDEAEGPRFPDMSMAYDKGLRERAKMVARREGFELREGVYLGWSGPSFETPAEYRMARVIGADAVGMSTVPEVIVARHRGMRVLGLSTITNCAFGSGGEAQVNSHEDVQRAAAEAAGRLAAVIKGVVEKNEG